MKKILSITLSLLILAQPLYGAAEPERERKVFNWFKERFMGVRELTKDVAGVVSQGSDCLMFGKGEDCTPEKGRVLKALRSFLRGDYGSAREGFIVFLDAYVTQAAAILHLLGIKIADASLRSVLKGINEFASKGIISMIRAYRKARVKLREMKKEHQEKMAKLHAKSKK